MDKVYYIKGSKENPKAVKQALIDACPDAEYINNVNNFTYKIEDGIYYVLDNAIYFSDDSYISAALVKRFGTELQPKKQKKFVEKTMFKCIYKGAIYNRYCDNEFLYKKSARKPRNL